MAMPSRDSSVLWLGVAIGVLGYLGQQSPIPEWTYPDVIAAASFVLALAMTKLQSSPLKGKKDKETL